VKKSFILFIEKLNLMYINKYFADSFLFAARSSAGYEGLIQKLKNERILDTANYQEENDPYKLKDLSRKGKFFCVRVSFSYYNYYYH
jgi:hypothetical protein